VNLLHPRSYVNVPLRASSYMSRTSCKRNTKESKQAEKFEKRHF
jgi:hypothetical protein